MSNDKKDDNGKILKMHSALVTFKSINNNYYKVSTEKIINLLLLNAQETMQQTYRDTFIELTKQLIINEEYKENLLENIYNRKKIDISENDIDIEELINISKKITLFRKEKLLKSPLEKKDRLKLEGVINDSQLLLISNTNTQSKMLFSTEQINDAINDIKNYCKEIAVDSYNGKKHINLTALTNKLGINIKRIKKELNESMDVKLSFNYINKKNLDISLTTNILGSITFTKDKDNTWLSYQIPEEILNLYLMPEVYVPIKDLEVYQLTYKYSIRMHSLLKDHIKFGYLQITKEELKTFLLLSDTYLKNQHLLKTKVLDPTLTELKVIAHLDVEYELIPKFNWQEIRFTMKKTTEIKSPDIKVIEYNEVITLEDNEHILKQIENTKKNIYVQKSWTKRTDNKIIKMLREYDDKFVIEILQALYDSLNTTIETTLVQYINGIIKNIEKENRIRVELAKKKNKQLQKVSNKQELKNKIKEATEQIKKEKELQKVSNISLLQKCKNENRKKVNGSYVITKEEWDEEIAKFLSSVETEDEKEAMINMINTTLTPKFILSEEEE